MVWICLQLGCNVGMRKQHLRSYKSWEFLTVHFPCRVLWVCVKMRKITDMWKILSKHCHFDMVLYKDSGHSSSYPSGSLSIFRSRVSFIVGHFIVKTCKSASLSSTVCVCVCVCVCAHVYIRMRVRGREISRISCGCGAVLLTQGIFCWGASVTGLYTQSLGTAVCWMKESLVWECSVGALGSCSLVYRVSQDFRA